MYLRELNKLYSVSPQTCVYLSHDARVQDYLVRLATIENDKLNKML